MDDNRAVTALPKAIGLFETHLTVSDLDRAVAFYRDVVGLPLPERGAAFMWVGGPGRAMLGLWSLGSAPLGLSLHIALTASLEDVLGACDALRARDVTPLSFFDTETSEPSVIGWMPAAVYFRDPDGHLIEYLAMLDEPARPELGIAPWSRWPRTAAATGAARVERHTGRPAGLRALLSRPRTLRSSSTRTWRRATFSSRSPRGAWSDTSSSRRRRTPRGARSRTWPSRPRTRPRVGPSSDTRRHRRGARPGRLDTHGGDRGRRRRQSALLPAHRLPPALDPARRLLARDRLELRLEA